MSIRLLSMLAVIAALAVLCGCAGYFHYHPVSSTEQVRARAAGEEIFPPGEFGSPLAPGISGVPIAEEAIIEEEAIIK